MSLETVHNVELGTYQLLHAPDDLGGLALAQGLARPRREATRGHGKLYEEYLADFVMAYEVAEEWWRSCVSAHVSAGVPRSLAIDTAFEKRLAGPASAPEFVWFIRLYWLLCDEINRGLPEWDRVPPQVFLLGWLVDDGLNDYVQLVTAMPYWPIGLDENGNWC